MVVLCTLEGEVGSLEVWLVQFASLMFEKDCHFGCKKFGSNGGPPFPWLQKLGNTVDHASSPLHLTTLDPPPESLLILSAGQAVTKGLVLFGCAVGQMAHHKVVHVCLLFS